MAEQTTTDQAQEREQVPTKPEPVKDETKKDDKEKVDFKGAEGAVDERDQSGKKFKVPYVHLTTEKKARTSDSDDPAKNWTAQDAQGVHENEDGEKVVKALTEVAAEPGQTFREDELPDRKVVEAAGIDYDQWVATLPVRATVKNEATRKGIPA